MNRALASRGTILIVGVSVRAMAESAVRSKYAVVALDGFGDQDLRAMTEAHALMPEFHIPYSARALFEAGRTLDCSAVAYTSNLENHPEVLDLFAANHRIIGNSPQAVRAVRCWPDLFSRLERAGFPVPETVLGGAAGQNSGRRWLMKPILSGGGHGIDFWEGQELAEKRVMLQQYVPGKPCSASFVANGSEAVLVGIGEQLMGLGWLGAQKFRYCGSILPLPELFDMETRKTVLEQTRQMSTFLTREFGLTGVNGFDFILQEKTVFLIEVNPRYSASMELVERACDLPVFHLHVEAVVNGRLPEFSLESQLSGSHFFGKAVLFCEKNCTAPEMVNGPDSELRDIPLPGTQLREGSPICTLLTSRRTHEDVRTELFCRASALKRKIYG